ncbi:hypothetical protein, partial [Sulfitobacter sp. PM12]|uniref:hypothetical protein n=1 Tax=Sulfitobacter sp. PM12 TaxID=3138497 RepID=UPI00389045B1
SAPIRGRVFYVTARYFSRLLPDQPDSCKHFLDIASCTKSTTRVAFHYSEAVVVRDLLRGA